EQRIIHCKEASAGANGPSVAYLPLILERCTVAKTIIIIIKERVRRGGFTVHRRLAKVVIGKNADHEAVDLPVEASLDRPEQSSVTEIIRLSKIDKKIVVNIHIRFIFRMDKGEHSATAHADVEARPSRSRRRRRKVRGDRWRCHKNRCERSQC